MPTIGWIDALRQYNAGMPSWCVPRKGTPGYDMVMRIRQGEKPKKEVEDIVEIPMADSKMDAPSTKKMSVSKDKSMKSVYFHKDKFEYTIWHLDGDTFTQLADWNSQDTARGKAGFVKTASRTRKTINNGLSYLTPKDKKNVWVDPLTDLSSSPSRLQKEIVAGLEAMGYTKDIEFKETASAKDIEMEETNAKLGGKSDAELKGDAKTKKTRRVDTPEVLNLLAEQKKVEDEQTDLVRRRDAKEFPSDDPAYFKKIKKFQSRLDEIQKEVRKLRLAQTKAMKKV